MASLPEIILVEGVPAEDPANTGEVKTIDALITHLVKGRLAQGLSFAMVLSDEDFAVLDQLRDDMALMKVDMAAMKTDMALVAGEATDPEPTPVDHSTTGIADARKVVAAAGTEEAIVAAATPAKWVIIQAETDNTGVIVVGGATVVAAQATRRGVSLAAGDSVTLPVNDLADVFIDSTISGDGVTFLYGT